MSTEQKVLLTNSSPYLVGCVSLLLAAALGLVALVTDWVPTLFISPESYLEAIAQPPSAHAIQNGLDASNHHTLFLTQSFFFQCLALEFLLLFIGFLILPKSIVVDEMFVQQTRVLACVTVFAIFVVAITPFYACEGLRWRCASTYRPFLAVAGFGSIALVILPSVFLFFYTSLSRS